MGGWEEEGKSWRWKGVFHALIGEAAGVLSELGGQSCGVNVWFTPPTFSLFFKFIFLRGAKLPSGVEIYGLRERKHRKEPNNTVAKCSTTVGGTQWRSISHIFWAKGATAWAAVLWAKGEKLHPHFFDSVKSVATQGNTLLETLPLFAASLACGSQFESRRGVLA